MASKRGGTLTDKQRRFVEEYVKDLNATQACIRAGYSAKGARTQGSLLLANPNVARAVQERQQKVSKRAEIDAAYVLRAWKTLIDTGLVKIPKTDMSGTQACDEHGRPAFKFVDALAANVALANLAKHLRMFEKPEDNAGDEQEQSSGVLRVPAPVSPEEWEKSK